MMVAIRIVVWSILVATFGPHKNFRRWVAGETLRLDLVADRRGTGVGQTVVYRLAARLAREFSTPRVLTILIPGFPNASNFSPGRETGRVQAMELRRQDGPPRRSATGGRASRSVGAVARSAA
jgi:hypothetical protein